LKELTEYEENLFEDNAFAFSKKTLYHEICKKSNLQWTMENYTDDPEYLYYF